MPPSAKTADIAQVLEQCVRSNDAEFAQFTGERRALPKQLVRRFVPPHWTAVFTAFDDAKKIVKKPRQKKTALRAVPHTAPHRGARCPSEESLPEVQK